jgi:hypothetical protein
LDDDHLIAFEQVLSAERFAKYKIWAGGDPRQAMELYNLNCSLAESLYPSLQMLEIVLRNRIHTVASRADVGDVSQHWYDRPEFGLGTRQAEQLAKAKQDIIEDGKTIEASRLVAGLTFGYWTAFFGPDYESLWQTHLNKVARRDNGKGLRRKDFAAPLKKLRMLRNRIAHHEPVLAWDLRKHHAAVVELTGWLSPIAADWTRAQSRFHSVYPADGLTLIEDAK